jgi:hypothetical protein
MVSTFRIINSNAEDPAQKKSFVFESDKNESPSFQNASYFCFTSQNVGLNFKIRELMRSFYF